MKFRFFSNTEDKEVSTVEKQPKMSLVEEIHHSFNTEIDNILAECNILLSTHDINKELKEKVDKLKSFGFINTPEIEYFESLIKENNQTEKDNSIKKQIIEDINYFREKYPHYKIIDEKSLDLICNKYQLCYAATVFFKGIIPNKNLQDIVNFKIDDNDKLFVENSRSDLYDLSRLNFKVKIISSNRDIELYEENPSRYNWIDPRDKYNRNITETLIIAAPSKDFKLDLFDNKKQEKYGKLKTIVKEDPIVMQPVFRGQQYGFRTYFIIITAWGDEAKDSLVLNEKMN